MFNEWLIKNKEAFISFGDMFIALIGDVDRVCALADKDLEKVARIFKLIFFSPIGGLNDTEAPFLVEILEYLKGEHDA